MLFHHVPSFAQFLLPDYVWHKSRTEKKIFLTFDDGPVPGITDFVLKELSSRQMKATFFMVGDNVTKHPALARKVKAQGHQIGNHTYNHVKGSALPVDKYLENVAKCQTALQEVLDIQPNIFRPPYGRIKRQQRKGLLKTYQIILWDVIAGDYDQRQSSELCLSKIKRYTHNGSIILFHDQKKTERLVFSVLPSFLDFIQAQGYRTGLL